MRGYGTAGFGALVIVAATGCFEPSYPVGLLCSPNGECPGNQVCINEVCVLRSPQVDPDGGGFALPDAHVPVYYDATPCVPISADDATCDGVDDDCDGSFDEDAGSSTIYYRDSDHDSYGLASASLNACARPVGYVDRAGDCWDSLTEPERSFEARPGQDVHQPGLLAESTTGELGDWNCDGTIFYWESQCSLYCEQHPACIYYYEGWLNMFPECGETREFCYSYDEYDNFCVESEPRAQRCL